MAAMPPLKSGLEFFTNKQKSKIMVQIINNGPAMPTSTQKAIKNAAANLGVSEVHATHVSQDCDNHIFDIYDHNENYLFSINTDGNVIFDR